MSTSIGDIVATLSLDSSQFVGGANSARQQLAGLDQSSALTAQHVTALGHEFAATQLQTAGVTRELSHATSATRELTQATSNADLGVHGLSDQMGVNERATRTWGDSLWLTAKAAGGVFAAMKGLMAFGSPGGAKGIAGLAYRGAAIVGGAYGATKAVGATRDLIRGPGESPEQLPVAAVPPPVPAAAGEGRSLAGTAASLVGGRVVSMAAARLAPMAGPIGIAVAATAALTYGIYKLHAAGAAAAAEMEHFNKAFQESAGGPRLSADELSKWVDVAVEGSRDGSRSVKELAATLGDFHATTRQTFGGGTREAAAASLQQITQLGTISGLSDKDAIAVQHDVLTTYNLRSRDISIEYDANYQKVLNDQLAAGSEFANVNVKDISTELKSFGQDTSGIGYDLRDSTLAVTAFAKEGRSATEELGAGLPELQLRAISNKDAFDALGLSLTDEANRLKPLPDLAFDLVRATDGLSDSQRQAAIDSLGLTDASRKSVEALIELQPEIHKTALALDASSGAANRSAEELSTGYSRAWARIGGAGEAASSALGTAWAKVDAVTTRTKETLLAPFVDAGAVALEWASNKAQAAANWAGEKVDWFSAQLGQLRSQAETDDIALPQTQAKLTLNLTDAENVGDEYDQQAAKAHELELRLGDLQTVYDTGGLSAVEFGRAQRVVAAGLDAATGGVAATIRDLKADIANLDLTEPQKREHKAADLGASSAAINEMNAVQAQFDAAKQVKDLRSQISDLDRTEPEKRHAANLQTGLSDADSTAIGELQSALDVAKQLKDLRSQISDLQLTEPEQRAAKLTAGGASDFEVQQVADAAAELDYLKQAKDLRSEISNLKLSADDQQRERFAAGGLDADQGQELLDLQAERDAIKEAKQQAADDKSAASKIVTGLQTDDDKTRAELAEIDRLKQAGLLTDQQAAARVDQLREKWDKANQSTREHAAAVNSAADAYSGQAQDMIAKTIALGEAAAAKPKGPAFPGGPAANVLPPLAAIDANFAQPVQLAAAIDNPPADPQFADRVRKQQAANADGDPAAIAKTLEKLAEGIAQVLAELTRHTDPLNRTARATQALAESVADV